ncbi:hypothetical protein Hdeb2414_s0025g00662651 [Helianthus debilis subsp. tardiflorus]
MKHKAGLSFSLSSTYSPLKESPSLEWFVNGGDTFRNSRFKPRHTCLSARE